MFFFAVAAALVAVAMPTAQAAAPAPLTIGAEVAVASARPGAVQSEASVAWNGSVFLAVWQERVGGGPAEVYAARISTAGKVLDPGGVLLSTSENSHVHPRVAGGGGKFLVVWVEEIEGTYSDLGAAMVTGAGVVAKRWGLSFSDNEQSWPDVAWNGQLFLAVWEDEPDPTNEDIYGARVTVGGLTLDGCSSDSCPNGDDPGIPIAVGAGNEVIPAVAANSGLFLVSWTDKTNPASASRMTSVATNGHALDLGGVTLAPASGAQSQQAVTRNGVSALFAWADQRSGTSSDVFAVTMKPGDEANYFPVPTPVGGFAVSAAAGDQTDPTLVRRGTGYVTAWTDTRSGNADIYAARVGVGGAVFDAAGVPVATGARIQTAPSAASSGHVVVLAYQHDVPGATFGGRVRTFFKLVT